MVAAADPRYVVSLQAVLKRDRRAGTALGGVTGAVIGVAFGLASSAGLGLAVGGWAAIAIAGMALAAASITLKAWPTYEIARVWLALRHRLPWPLMTFLADAHRRGVLRQAGAVYQFRHIELQHRLANRDADVP